MEVSFADSVVIGTSAEISVEYARISSNSSLYLVIDNHRVRLDTLDVSVKLFYPLGGHLHLDAIIARSDDRFLIRIETGNIATSEAPGKLQLDFHSHLLLEYVLSLLLAHLKP